MVIDIGEGTADMGIISLGGTVISKTIRFGGGDLDRASCNILISVLV